MHTHNNFILSVPLYHLLFCQKLTHGAFLWYTVVSRNQIPSLYFGPSEWMKKNPIDFFVLHCVFANVVIFKLSPHTNTHCILVEMNYFLFLSLSSKNRQRKKISEKIKPNRKSRRMSKMKTRKHVMWRELRLTRKGSIACCSSWFPSPCQVEKHWNMLHIHVNTSVQWICKWSVILRNH